MEGVFSSEDEGENDMLSGIHSSDDDYKPLRQVAKKKKGNVNKFQIALFFLWGQADQGQYVWGSGGFYASLFDLPKGGEGENDGAASSRSCLVDYQLHFQQLRASGVYILKYVMGSNPKLCL